MKTFRTLILGVLVLLFSALALGQEPVRGGTLTFGLLDDPASLDPHVYSGDQTMVLKQVVYSTLVRFGQEGGGFVGDLAESWEVPEPTRYIFTLVDGATFHDGTPVTAEDVRFSLERILDPATSATRHADLQVITDINVVDDRTVELTLESPNAALLAFLARPESAIVSKAHVESGASLATEMMGSGPFMLQDYEQGVEIVVERHPDYHVDGVPYLDAIRFIPISDESTRVNALLSGEVQATHFIPWTAMNQIDSSPDFDLYLHTDAVLFLQFNVQRPPFDDQRVRQAVAHAINREGVIRAAFLGRGSTITGGVIPSEHWAHNEGLEGTYSYNPDRARELLEEAGAVGATVTIDTYSLPFAVRTAEVVQSSLQQIGLNADIAVSEWPTFQEKTTLNGDFHARVYGAGWRVPDLDFWTPFVGTGGEFAAPAGFSDPELDALLEQGRQEIDEEARKEIYRQVEERVLELSPMAFIGWRVNAWAADSSVEGLELVPDPMGPLSGYNLALAWLAE